MSISFYDQPGSQTATQANADACTKQSGGKYKIDYIKLPTAADQQRLQLVRRMAAGDTSVDIMGLDVTWEAEFAEAGWILPWTGQNETNARKDQLAGPLATATWQGKVVAIPYNSNTQLLWYRKDLVPKPPATWDQMISQAEALAKQGKPHYIEEQGAQYEGLTVWFNSMVASAGGTILSPDSKTVTLGPPAVTALTTMHRLATSAAADPSLSNDQEDQGRLSMESGTAAFEINYPYVWPSMQQDKPKVLQELRLGAVPDSRRRQAGPVDDRRHRPGDQQIHPAPRSRLPGRDLPGQRAQPARRRDPGRSAAHPAVAVHPSHRRLQEGLPLLPGHLQAAAERDRPPPDTGLPERVDRHPARVVAAQRDRSAADGQGTQVPDIRRAPIQGFGPMIVHECELVRPR